MDRKEAVKLTVILLAVFALTAVFGREPGATQNMIRHYRAENRAKDCSVYKAVARKARTAIEGLKDILVEQQEIVESKERLALDCAKAVGVRELTSEKDLAVTAQECPDEYGAMLSIEYSIYNHQLDLDEWREGLRTLQREAVYFCGDRV